MVGRLEQNDLVLVGLDLGLDLLNAQQDEIGEHGGEDDDEVVAEDGQRHVVDDDEDAAAEHSEDDEHDGDDAEGVHQVS